MRNDLTIRTLAKRSGVNVETIRYYQRLHLLLDLDERKACLTRGVAAQKLTPIKQKISDLLRMKRALSATVHSRDSSSAGEALSNYPFARRGLNDRIVTWDARRKAGPRESPKKFSKITKSISRLVASRARRR